jgi:uncharacterized membrane protein YcaP (DUF421 family)
MDDLFFNGWEPLIRILVVGLCSYVAMIAMLRAAGKRALSKMNAYDLIVTMAVGSILGKIVITKDISLSEGIAASALLIGLQFVMTWASSRLKWVHRLVASEPVVVFHDGRFHREAMDSEHIAERDIIAAANKMGLEDLSPVKAVILSATGTLDVILKQPPAAGPQAVE